MQISGNNSYDLVVIGSGPAGQKAAICAAKMRKKVAVIERKRSIGGVCVNTGTIPSKTFREAVLYLSGLRQRSFYGRGYAVKDQIAMHDLVFRSDAVMAREIEVIKSQLRRNRVTVLEGNARFVADHTIEVQSDLGSTVVHGDYFVIACGTRPAHDEQIPIDGKRIFDSDQVHDLQELPRELIVVGAGIIGLEYASMFAALGVKVTVLDQRPMHAGFCRSRDCGKPLFPAPAIGNGLSPRRKGRGGGIRRRARSRVRQAGKRQDGTWAGAAVCRRPPGQQRSS